MPFKKGDPNINRKGRIDGGGGLKAYDRDKFKDMSDEEKDKFLKTISPELRYKMAEGNPESKTDLTSAGEAIKSNQIVFENFKKDEADSK